MTDLNIEWGWTEKGVDVSRGIEDAYMKLADLYDDVVCYDPKIIPGSDGIHFTPDGLEAIGTGLAGKIQKLESGRQRAVVSSDRRFSQVFGKFITRR